MLLVKNERLRLDMDVSGWFDAIGRVGRVRFAPMTLTLQWPQRILHRSSIEIRRTE